MMSQLKVGNKLFEILDNVPEEYTALSDAISRLFYVCGSGKLCGACFQGKLINYSCRTASDITIRSFRKLHPRAYESHGCCGNCPNLSTTGCVQKPLGCAAWQCPYSAILLPERVSFFLSGNFGIDAEPSAYRRRSQGLLYGTLSRWLHKRTGRFLFDFFRIRGFDVPLDAKGLKALTIAAKRVNRISDWLERTGLNKPNWPLMEKITRAEKGVLYEPSV